MTLHWAAAMLEKVRVQIAPLHGKKRKQIVKTATFLLVKDSKDGKSTGRNIVQILCDLLAQLTNKDPSAAAYV